MSNTNLTITLTERRPVTIVKDDWPILASAEDTDDRAHPEQANRRWKLIVRQHADGRSIVYGVYTSAFLDARDVRGGVLVEAEGDIEAAIYEVTASLDFDRALADQCVADLPAEELA